MGTWAWPVTASVAGCQVPRAVSPPGTWTPQQTHGAGSGWNAADILRDWMGLLLPRPPPPHQGRGSASQLSHGATAGGGKLGRSVLCLPRPPMHVTPGSAAQRPPIPSFLLPGNTQFCVFGGRTYVTEVSVEAAALKAAAARLALPFCSELGEASRAGDPAVSRSVNVLGLP